jgi:hypothetical protein
LPRKNKSAGFRRPFGRMKFGNKPTYMVDRMLFTDKKLAEKLAAANEVEIERFDSKAEAVRHLELLDKVDRKEITGLVRQPVFRLEVEGTWITTYRADWRYYDLINECVAVEDKKGFETPEFKIKWRLVQALHPDIDFRLS